LAGDDTGGSHARTMSLDLADGTVRIKSRDDNKVLWKPVGLAASTTPIGRTQ